jgi:hypothetical protein
MANFMTAFLVVGVALNLRVATQDRSRALEDRGCVEMPARVPGVTGMT